MPMIRVFRYIDRLDAFVVTDEYRRIADRLGLTEGNPVVWIGRLFMLDNDYGEHWFDNWAERMALVKKAQRLKIDPDQLLIIVPDRFKNDADGPSHPPELRKQFWTDVLKSLELSYETLFEKARQGNAFARDHFRKDYIEDLEDRIELLQSSIPRETGADVKQETPDRHNQYTRTQGRYLAFIHYYTMLHGCPPAEADIQHYFRVAPPSVHQMIVTLERRGLIKRLPGQARTIRVLLPPEELPSLD